MTRNTASYVISCFVLVSLIGTPALAQNAQQPVEHPIAETAKVAQKGKTTAIRKATTPSKSATATAKVVDKPGKRFWSRIMSCFRDVHAVEKKTNK